MQIDYCLILAAGFGTRMGSIGKKLPKVLWPVFEKSLLELQVAYAKSLGIKKIFINLHHMGEEIELYCKGKEAFEGVQFLWETPEILDIGGAIHNLASLKEVSYKGKLLVLNADQFFYLSKAEIEKYLEGFNHSPCMLFSYWVESNLGYNALEISSERVVRSIIKNKDLTLNSKVETYTGIAIVELSLLMKKHGPSAFFESVCDFKKNEIKAILLKDVDYWDFGTLKRYWETSFRILETYKVNSNHPFLRFLVASRALKTWKINLQQIAYNSSVPRVINLTPDSIMEEINPSIILCPSNYKKLKGQWIWWNSLNEEIT